MKNILLAGFISLTMMMSAESVMALYLSDGTDVGGIDRIFTDASGDFAMTNLGNSSEAEELAWVNEVLGLTGDAIFTTFVKDDDLNGDWKGVEDGVFAYSLSVSTSPEYFLIKAGNIKETNFDHFLFENKTGYDWAVVELNDMGITDIKNVSKLSHLDQFGTAAPVPEPATILLFGTGLIGIAGFSRKKKI